MDVKMTVSQDTNLNHSHFPTEQLIKMLVKNRLLFIFNNRYRQFNPPIFPIEAIYMISWNQISDYAFLQFDITTNLMLTIKLPARKHRDLRLVFYEMISG